jgi:uncharacterized protein (TIGR03437 family)
MRNSVRAALLFILIRAAIASPPNQFVVGYLPIGPSGSTSLLAADAHGNLFIVGTVTETSGRPQIRAIKTDPQGNELASLDFGGSLAAAAAAAVDPQGNLVVVGTTYSQDFVLVSPLISSAGFVVKLDSQLTKILFSTKLGGSQGNTQANAVTLDRAGNIYVAGSTSATDFPVIPGAFQVDGPPASDDGLPTYAFATEISPNGTSLIYSTYYGSESTNCAGDSCIGVFGQTAATTIAVDDTGAVVIAGDTTSNELGVTPGVIGQQCGCFISEFQESEPGFIIKFAAGWRLAWSTYVVLAPSPSQMQSSATVTITTVAIDDDGSIVFGGSASDGLIITPGALQGMYPSGTPPPDQSTAGFVAKLNSSATAYLFSTYFGGDITFGSPTGVSALALDAQGNIWATGGSAPAVLPFPSSIPALGSTYLAELAPDGAVLLDGINAPAGAMGQAIALTSTGAPTVLGTAGSLVMNLAGQPASLVGVANAAGIQVLGEVAPYELISLYGIGIGPPNALGAQVVNGVLTDSLGGVQVLFNNVAAPLLYAGPNQINAIVPSSASEQTTATLQVVTPNGTLAGPTLSVVPAEPEVFQNGPPMQQGGTAVALNQDGSLNSATNPAAGESIVTIWATGAGNTNSPDSQDGVIATDLYAPLLPVSVLNSGELNGQAGSTLEVLYAGNAPGIVTGVLQVNFRLPPIESQSVNLVTCQLQVGAAVSSRFAIYMKP